MPFDPPRARYRSSAPATHSPHAIPPQATHDRLYPIASRLPMQPTLVVLVLSLLLGIQPITTDLYLPALPALTQGFGATMGQAQLTLSALLLAFGISQLFWGPLSDRFGRRPVLLWGLAAYALASIGSAVAPSMPWLIGWRVMQGAAMGAAVMCARAIVRDLYQPAEGARVMSQGLTGLGVLACISPAVGGLLAEAFGWRATLLAVALFGAGTFAVVAWRFQETLQAPNPRALQPATLVSTWLTIIRHPAFLAFSLLASTSYAGLFTFLASSSFVLIGVMGLSKMQYGLAMFSTAVAYVLGTLLCRRLLPRLGVHRSVAVAACFTLAGGSLMGALALAGVHSVWAILLPQCLFMVGHGVHQPCSQSGAIGPFPHAAGAASALNGFLMMLFAFGMGSWLGTHMDSTVLPLTNGVWFWSVCIALTAFTAVQKYGELTAVPTATPPAAVP